MGSPANELKWKARVSVDSVCNAKVSNKKKAIFVVPFNVQFNRVAAANPRLLATHRLKIGGCTFSGWVKGGEMA